MTISLPKAFDMQGQRVLITGAAGGIGSETAKLCSELGAITILTDIASVTKKLEVLAASLKNVEALHKCLRLNKLAKHIPKSNQLLEDKPVSRRKLQEDITVANTNNTSIDKRVDKRRNRSSKNRNSKKRARRDEA
jgi:NAD(P)-dependent dehydrogenase (short-subunit alcohol dehydrogenase family)